MTIPNCNPFSCSTKMTPDPDSDRRMFVDTSKQSTPQSVAVVMTPGQARQLAMSNYPRYDWLDTHHVRRSNTRD